MTDNYKKGLFFALTATFLMSFFPLAFRELGKLHEALLCVLALFLVSFLFSSIPMIIKPSRFRLNKKSYFFVIAIGLFSVVGNWSYMQSLQMLDPAISSTIQRVELIFAAILGALFLAEKITFHIIIAIAFSLIGLFFLQGAVFSINDFLLEAIAITLLSAWSFACMLLFSKLAMRYISVFTMNFYRLLFIAVFLSISLNLFNKLSELSLFAWLLVAISALCGPVGARFFITSSLQYISMSTALLYTMLAPVLAFYWQWLFFDLIFNLTEILGAGLILTGVLFTILREQTKKLPEKNINDPV